MIGRVRKASSACELVQEPRAIDEDIQGDHASSLPRSRSATWSRPNVLQLSGFGQASARRRKRESEDIARSRLSRGGVATLASAFNRELRVQADREYEPSQTFSVLLDGTGNACWRLGIQKYREFLHGTSVSKWFQ